MSGIESSGLDNIMRKYSFNYFHLLGVLGGCRSSSKTNLIFWAGKNQIFKNRREAAFPKFYLVSYVQFWDLLLIFQESYGCKCDFQMSLLVKIDQNPKIFQIFGVKKFKFAIIFLRKNIFSKFFLCKRFQPSMRILVYF